MMGLIVIDVPTEIYCCCYSSPFCRGFLVKIALCSGADLIPQNCTCKMFRRLHWSNSKGDARGVEVPEELCKELPQKKVGAGGSASLAESGARTGLQRGLFDRAEVASYCKGRRPRPAARKCDRAPECQLEHNNFFLFKHKHCMFF